MNGPVDQALQKLGVNTGGVDPVGGMSEAVSQFNTQNLSPADIYRATQKFPRTVGGAIPEIGARIPELGRIPIPYPKIGGAIGKALDMSSAVFFGAGGEWQTLRYGYDMNRVHPKLKFLFKVGFYGFDTRDFYYYVHRCDKPKVRLIHQDVNYYNFRTRVLTNTTFEPLSITFLDDITNSFNDFFVEYMTKHSNQGSQGRAAADINEGFGIASSSLPYKNGYSTGTAIIVEQVFANGENSNRFTFVNPRIETFDFDELAMDESAGSMCTLTFSYDALQMDTAYRSTIYSWGETDLLRGGGTSGEANAGNTSGVGDGDGGASVDNGSPLGTLGRSIGKQVDSAYGALQGGIRTISQVPGAIADMVTGGVEKIKGYTKSSPVSSNTDVVSSNIQGTLNTISSGANMTPAQTFPADLSMPEARPLDTLGQKFP